MKRIRRKRDLPPRPHALPEGPKVRPLLPTEDDCRAAQGALQVLVEGTSLVVGTGFFRALVRHLASTLRVRYAFVSELCPEDRQRSHTLAWWNDSDFGENFEYALSGTPCEKVFAEDGAFYPRGVQRRFPEDYWLQAQGIESYLAVPLYDRGKNSIGHLGLMHNGPMADDLPRESILRIFAGRAGAELQRERAEGVLALVEHENELILNAAGEGIYGLDADGETTFVNPAAAKMLGWTSAELIGRSMHDIVHHTKPDGSPYPRAECPVYAAFRDGVVHRVDSEVFWRKDGTGFPVEYTSTPIQERDKIVGAVVVFRDITERKRAERQLRALVEGFPDAVVITNEQGDITLVNAQTEKLFGYERGELLGKKVETLMPERFRRKHRQKYIDYCGAPYTRGFEAEPELWGLRKDGEEIPLDISLSPLETPEGALVLSAIRDITERKRAEKRLREYQNQLRTLASEISLTEERERRRIAVELHDRTIQNLGLSRIKLGALQESMTSSCESAKVKDIQKLIGQIIHDTRSLVFELSPPILYDLGFEPAIEWLAERLQEHDGVSCRVLADGQPMTVDRDVQVALFHAVRELLANIRKHAHATDATVSLSSEGDHMVIRIADNGVGFDVSTVSTRAVEQGGFGLFSIRERLGLLGGNLDVESMRGKGTRVTLTAPSHLSA